MSHQSSSFRSGLVTALPIALGYFPIAFAFGVAATGAGLRPWEAVALSLIVFAGAAQFLALALVTAGAALPVAAATLIATNIRHVLYGPALLKRAGQAATTRWSPLWAFTLTDEVFGAALGQMARGGRFSEPFMIALGLGAYASWVSGTALGAWAGGAALADWPVVQAGLGFLLPALFLSLLLSILTRRQVPVIAVAAMATLAGTVAWSGTAGLLGGMVAGALWGTFGPERGVAE